MNEEKRNPNLRFKRSNSQLSVEGEPNLNNQKKNSENGTSKKVQFPKFFVNEYMKTIIKQKGTTSNFICSICPDKPIIQKKSIYRHILESATHEKSLTKSNEEKHSEMRALIQEKVNKNKTKRNKNPQNNEDEKKAYLKFIGFCQKLNLSFNQISELGKFLKEMSSNKEIFFFENHTFEREEVSSIANCFGQCFLSQLKDDLEKSPFSFCIDNSTVARLNICALKVRYLKESLDEQGSVRTSIQNKIIGIKYLKDSSNAKTLFDITKEKLLNLSEKVKSNLVGIAHDHASTLSGPLNGLGTLIAEHLPQYFMDLKDPCHSLNLSLSNSLEILPQDLSKFVDNIHNHFASPQRVAYLFRVQRERSYKVLGLRRFVKTRWLSLGESLERLLIIWDSLAEYMKQRPKFIGLKKVKYDYFSSLLENKTFKMKIIVWAGIINKINSRNITFQSQHLEIQNLKSQIYLCIQELARLFIKPQHIPQDISNFVQTDWIDGPETRAKFLSFKDFISTLGTDLDPRISEVLDWEENVQEEITTNFQPYLCRIFRYLLKYLPYNDELIKILDFVTVNSPFPDLKQKILTFNNIFEIVPQDQIHFLSKEISLLPNDENLLWLQKNAKKSSLYLWDLIKLTNEENSFPLLTKIFMTAHTLPTSTAGVEQSFSILKLIRNVLRSNLHEKTTQSLLLIQQAFNEPDFTISDELINLYKKYRDEISERKKGKVRISLPSAQNLMENLEEVKSDILEIQSQKDPSPRKRKSMQNFDTDLKFMKTKETNLNNSDEKGILDEENIEEILNEDENEEEEEEENEQLRCYSDEFNLTEDEN